MSVPRGRAGGGPSEGPPPPPPPAALRVPAPAGRALLVGEGDLSFALALLRSGACPAAGLVASTLDSGPELRRLYAPWVRRTLADLEAAGARVVHGVDATRLGEAATLATVDPEGGGFDLVVWNHPHAGFPARRRGPGFENDEKWQASHRALVEGFLRAAPAVLRAGGRVVVSSKSGPPFGDWGIPALGRSAGLVLAGEEPFPAAAFPTFVNRRGVGKNAAKMFPMDDSVMYAFERAGDGGAGGAPGPELGAELGRGGDEGRGGGGPVEPPSSVRLTEERASKRARTEAARLSN